jgi:glutathionyl-hydroquinone reductase
VGYILIRGVQFDDFVDDKYKGVTFYPEELRKEIDELNDWVYPTIKYVS